MTDAKASKPDESKPDPKGAEEPATTPKRAAKQKAEAKPQAAAKPKPATTPAVVSEAGPETPGLTHADVARFIDALVRVPRLKDGKPIIEKGVYAIQELKAEAKDILAFRVDGDTLRVVTVDGQKFELHR